MANESPYSDEYATKETEMQDGMPNASNHIRFVYDELGDNPSGDHDTVADRLEVLDPSEGGGPGPDNYQSPTVPSGYQREWLEEFNDSSALTNFDLEYNVDQGHGTISYNAGENSFVQDGMLRLRLDNANHPSSAAHLTYTGAYCQKEWDSTDMKIPLFGTTEALIRSDMAHQNWVSLWMNGKGSAGIMECDIFEMFPAQTPGRASMQFHADSLGTHLLPWSTGGDTVWHYESGDGDGDSLAWVGPDPVSTRHGRHLDYSDPTAPDDPKWLKLRFERELVDLGGGDWTVDISVSWDDELLFTWTSPGGSSTGPAWCDSGDDALAHFWDIKLDHWAGGSGIGQGFAAGNYVYAFNGLNQNGTTSGMYTPNSTVPDGSADRFPLFFDIAWIQELTTPIGNPPPSTSIVGGDTFNSDLTGDDDDAIASTTATTPNSSFRNVYRANSGVATNVFTDTGVVAPHSMKSARHEHSAVADYDYGHCIFDPGGTTEYQQGAYRMFYRPSTAMLSESDESIMWVRDDASAAKLRLRQKSDGKLSLQVNEGGWNAVEGTGLLTTATSLTANTWYSIDILYDAVNNEIKLRVIDVDDNDGEPNNTIHTATMTGSITLTGSVQQCLYGSVEGITTVLDFHTAHHAASQADTGVVLIGAYDTAPT